METILLVVTILSLSVTAVSLAAARRVRRVDRQRSEARVAALAAAVEVQRPAEGGWKQAAGEWQWTTTTEGTTEPIVRPPQITFGTIQRGEATTGRVPLAAAAVLILLLGSALALLRTTDDQDLSAPVVAAAQTEPLELLSLGHTREATSLTITGIVRNPIAGHKLEGLTAVVSLLDNDGGLVSTKDVPLDYRAIGPGEEAPFKVSVPDSGSIARYRVSFRAGTELVPHVDHRTDVKLANVLQ